VQDQTELESNPLVAEANAIKNFERLIAGVPATIQDRESHLVEEVSRLPGSSIKKLRTLHRAMDELSEAISPYIACKKGCMACCHYTVHLYPVEAELIERRTGYKRLNRPLPSKNFHGAPCPFLKDGACGIYGDRPMTCRRHIALTSTAYWCQPDRCLDNPMPIANFSAAQLALEQLVQKDGRTQILDIRQVFGERSVFLE